MIQIKGEEGELPQMKRIEEMAPARGVRHIAVILDEGVVEMKRIVKRRSKKQYPRQNQSSRDFHAIFAQPIIQTCAPTDGLGASHGPRQSRLIRGLIRGRLPKFPNYTQPN